jgi:zinc transporter 1/2/3
MAGRMKTKMNLMCTVLLFLALLSIQLHPAGGHGGIDDGDGEAGGDSAPAVDRSVLRSKGLIAVKVWCLVILLVGTFLGGVSPYFYRWNEAFLLLGTQFAAGIFLGTALMHFLADATETFHGLTKNKYPFSFMLACAGFLLTMLSDVAIVAVARRQKNQVKEEGGEVDGVESSAAHGKHPMLMATAASSFEDAILLIVALCFHSIFEGIAIGVSGQQSTPHHASERTHAFFTFIICRATLHIAQPAKLTTSLRSIDNLTCTCSIATEHIRQKSKINCDVYI